MAMSHLPANPERSRGVNSEARMDRHGLMNLSTTAISCSNGEVNNYAAKAKEISALVHHVKREGLLCTTPHERVVDALTTDEERATAWLQCVLEGGTVMADDLRAESFPETIVSALEALARRPGEEHLAFLRRVKSHPIATRVFLASARERIANGSDPEQVQMSSAALIILSSPSSDPE